MVIAAESAGRHARPDVGGQAGVLRILFTLLELGRDGFAGDVTGDGLADDQTAKASFGEPVRAPYWSAVAGERPARSGAPP